MGAGAVRGAEEPPSQTRGRPSLEQGAGRKAVVRTPGPSPRRLQVPPTPGSTFSRGPTLPSDAGTTGPLQGDLAPLCSELLCALRGWGTETRSVGRRGPRLPGSRARRARSPSATGVLA